MHIRKFAVLLLAMSLLVIPFEVAVAVKGMALMVRSVPVKAFTDVSMISLKGKPPSPPGKPPKAPEANKWAVVIGISKYSDPSANVYNPSKDAKEMAWVLENIYGFPEDHIRLLTDNKGTKDNIVAAIDWLIENENSTSLVVFFYCGHGGQVEEGTYSEIYPNDEADGKDEYIVTYDLWGITDDYLELRFSEIESSTFILWFGSCHSGGMSPDLNGDGRVIVAACQEQEYAYDYVSLGNTVFGYFYIDQGIKQGYADGYGPNGVADGTVTVEEAFYYATPLVTQQQPSQHPFIWDSDPSADQNF